MKLGHLPAQEAESDTAQLVLRQVGGNRAAHETLENTQR